jgi:predicted nucleic acid-binding protein
MKCIADTGFIVAFLNRFDGHHEWATEIASKASAPLLTCEAVLSEATFNVASASRVMALVHDGLLKIAFDLSQNYEEVLELADRYRDRTPDLADLCLVRMSEIHANLSIVTVDETDFRVYRRNKREVIPILCPPRA